MSGGSEKYKNLFDKIDQLTKNDPEFRKELWKRYGEGDVVEKIKNIEKYLGLDFSLDKIDSIIDYSYIEDEYVRCQLISDNREMLRFRYGTRNHKIDFLEFCRYAHMQAEMLVNYYFDKEYNGDIEKIVECLKKNNPKARFSGYETKVSSISYITKCIAIKNIFSFDWLKGIDLDNLAAARNIQSHRSTDTFQIDLSYREKIKSSNLPLNYEKDDFVIKKIKEDDTLKNIYETKYNNEEYKNYKIHLWISKQPYDSVIEALRILSEKISAKVLDMDEIKAFEKKEEEISHGYDIKEDGAFIDEWTVTEVSALEQCDKNILREVVTTVSELETGISACFYLKKGGRFYIPMDRDAKVGIGDVLDMDKIKIKTLEKRGEKISRVSYDIKEVKTASIDECAEIDNDEKWKVVAIKHLETPEDVKRAEWCQGKFGLSLKVYLKAGGYFFIGVSSHSSITKATIIDWDNFDLLFLEKGKESINRLCLRGEISLDE